MIAFHSATIISAVLLQSSMRQVSGFTAVMPIRTTYSVSCKSYSPMPISTSTRLQMWNNNNDDESRFDSDDNEEDDYPLELEDLERAREKFEGLMRQQSLFGSSSTSAEVSSSSSTRNEIQNSFSDNDGGSSNRGGYQSIDGTSSSFHRKLHTSRLSESERVDEMTNILGRLIQKTERLLEAAESKISDCIDAEKLLTPSSRLYRENEMRMLSYMIDNEASEEALLHYWTTEYELYDHNHRMAMSNHINLNDPREVELKSTMLESLCETFPNWAEPNFRLARIKYHSKHYEYAEHYAMKAIQLKPWNFEAIRLLVAIFLDSGNMHEAQLWYERQLPRCDEQEKRAQWVQNAINEARKQLNEAEVFTTKFYQKQHHSGHASVVPFDSSVSHAFPSSFDTPEHTLSSGAVTFGSDFSISHSSFGTDNQIPSSWIDNSSIGDSDAAKKESLQDDEDAWQ
jgi:hypothetical protein